MLDGAIGIANGVGQRRRGNVVHVDGKPAPCRFTEGRGLAATRPEPPLGVVQIGARQWCAADDKGMRLPREGVERRGQLGEIADGRSSTRNWEALS